MAIKSIRKYNLVILFVILSAFVFNGCSVLKMGLELTQSRETKIFHERLDEISAEFKTRYEKKYGEEFEELGFRDIHRDGYIFWFKSKQTGVEFGSSYYGDYLLKHFPEKMKGKFEDNYWMSRIDYAVKQHFMPDVEEIFSGQFADLRIQASVQQGIGIEDMDEFYAWASDWDTDLSEFYDIRKLNYELNAEPMYDFLGFYFKDVTKENADELYQEMFNFVMKLKEEGIEDLDIHISVYDEKYLTDKRIDFVSSDSTALKNSLIAASKDTQVNFNLIDGNLTTINSYEKFLESIYVNNNKGTVLDIWLGGKDGN